MNQDMTHPLNIIPCNLGMITPELLSKHIHSFAYYFHMLDDAIIHNGVCLSLSQSVTLP